MWARIYGDRVAEITDIDPEGRFHPSIQWVPASNGVAVGDIFDGRGFSKVVTAEQKQLDAEKAKREKWKTSRAESVASIKVTTESGNTFDGDETSQGRMARAILGLQASGDPNSTVVWVLADNTVINATVSELSEALMLAGQAQADLWVMED